ncbi:hypothetical protein BASA50_006135 [Batrachochytrium salamandrivorans]|uniref:Uncharacterized protein n=1 Tax=Batrachochytrium salamandrivorans TaxID=1357716 RepID=A0ABQ8FDP7_9FUNG|nr:hypothetical protein BASA50_006135 [Batrachochytrium salamandrivorans]
MTKKLSSKEVRDDDSDLFKVVTAQTIFPGPYNCLFFTVNHEVIGQRLSQDDDDDEQSFIDIFRADSAPPVVHSVQNSNSFRNVNAFLAATKWGSENLDNIAYPASIIVKAIMVYSGRSPLRFIPLAVHKLARDTNRKIKNGVCLHIMQWGYARCGLPIENGGDNILNGS